MHSLRLKSSASRSVAQPSRPAGAVFRVRSVATTTKNIAVATAQIPEEPVPEPTTAAAAPATPETPRVKAWARSEVEELNRKLEAKAKALIALEEIQAAGRPKLSLTLRKQIGLGNIWKIVGNCPELGSMKPEVAPAMTWTDGDVWVLETPIREGHHTYKAVMRRADGAYIWEAGEDRNLEVSSDLGKDDKLSVELEVKLPY